MRRPLLLALALLLSACASVPRQPLAARDTLQAFAIEARFALRVTLPGQSAQSGGGRLDWSHDGHGDHILLANPLGFGIAEIETTPTLSTLHTSDGRTLTSADPDALIEEVTGQRLPVARLPGWLLGRGGAGTQLERDTAGRPLHLRDGAWKIDYFYDDEADGALPSRLTMTRDNEIELRLRIEQWRDTP
jgi:outer membrane lipoprotein LolB